MSKHRNSPISSMPTPAPRQEDWLVGGGEMGKLIRSMDWSKTPLGPIESWPQSLRTTVGLGLASNFPIAIAWGPKTVQIYNDGYWVICGAKHPRSMGQDFRECWASAWPTVGEAFERARAGETSYLENQRMFLDRNGYLEETFFTFSFSPIRDENGNVAGIFHPVVETTPKMLSERRTRVLRDLAARASRAHDAEEAFKLAAEVLGDFPLDLPFVLFYLVDSKAKEARLTNFAGIDPKYVANSALVPLSDATEDGWRIGEAVISNAFIEMDDVSARFPGLSGGPYPEAPKTAFVLPITPPGAEGPVGVVVAAASPRLPLNESYRAFFALLGAGLTSVVANACAYEAERKRAEALAEIDRAKSLFFSNVSHEFRTPLTLMLGPLEDALADTIEPLSSGKRAQVSMAHRSALRLLKLVNTLLDFSRLEAGRIQASYQETNLSVLTADLASLFRSAAERAGLVFTVQCSPLSSLASVDHEMWEKIVLNLLSNALKHTFSGEIAVVLREEDGRAILSVRDTGTGIPQAELPRVFERFHRVEGTRARSHEGSGIGLALVQELIKLHGGEVRVESIVGQGSTFTVAIPLGSDHLPKERLAAAKTLQSTAIGAAPFIEEALRWLPDDKGPASETPPLADALQRARRSATDVDVPASLRSARILLADDNADLRAYVTALLQRYFTVDAVTNGEEALRVAKERKPDLILADVMMPIVDGFELLRAVRSDNELRGTPVILLSARAGEESRVEGLEQGADDYIVKPFAARELIARVRSHLELSQIRAEISRHEATEKVLRVSEERLRLALEGAKMGMWEWDIRSNTAVWNAKEFELLGLPEREGPVTTELFFQLVHPDDANALQTALAKAMKTLNDWSSEFRVIRPNGEIRWLVGLGRLVHEADGQPSRMIGINYDITERKQVETALLEAHKRKDEFLAMLSHELRNPLTPIRNSLYILERTTPGSEQARGAQAVIDRQTRHLTRLVDDLLDVARISRGMIELRRERLDLGEIVARTIEDYRALFVARGIEVQVENDQPNTCLWVNADATRLMQALGNLLQNASKFTPAGGRVNVHVRRNGPSALVSVRDNGLGISPEIMKHLFEPFTQADRSLDRTSGGLGLGLALVKHLVVLHGGEVQAKSEGLGKGAEITIQLPLESESPRLEQSIQKIDNPHARRILVIEDNVDAAETLQAALELNDHLVTVAYTGPEGLAKARAFFPDVVFCDIGLPGMDGYDVARAFRADDTLKNIPLVALTGYAGPEAQSRAAIAGFDHHLAKPPSLDDIERLVARIPNRQLG